MIVQRCLKIKTQYILLALNLSLSPLEDATNRQMICIFRCILPTFIANFTGELPNAVSWASKFIVASHLLESYMLLHHHKEAKTLLYKFRSIDPDRSDRLTTDQSEIVHRVVNEQQNLEELAFLTQFAFVLNAAGYEKVPEDIVKQCIERPHTYDKIEVRSNVLGAVAFYKRLLLSLLVEFFVF